MPSGDHCAVWGCDNDRRYPDKQVILPHVGLLRFFSPTSRKDIATWERLINRANFKVTRSTKVCSNHFVAGYRSKDCRNPTLHLKGYGTDDEKEKSRPPPRKRSAGVPKQRVKRRKKSDPDTVDQSGDFPVPQSSPPISSPAPHGSLHKDRSLTMQEVFEKRRLFLEQVTSLKSCHRYTGLSRPKLDLVFALLSEKSDTMNYWRGSKCTSKPGWSKKKGKERVLSSWEEFVLTLVRTRKGFDVYFLADTFTITPGQVSSIYNTWIIFLSSELSFLVPWPSKAEIMKTLPNRFKPYPNIRIIIDCLELYLQKPFVLSSQKNTWSSYKHWNTAKLLIGITPTGVISFVPPMWTGSISDKEIVRNSGLLDLLEEGDAVMADKGFLIPDLLTFKKVHLISPAYCRRARMSARGTTHTRRVASLRSHVERIILKMKHFRILSGVIPIAMKPMLDRIAAAALSDPI